MARFRARDLGVLGEDLAASFLERRGVTVVARNVYVDRDEIDIIYSGSRGCVAVEVKTVSGPVDPFDGLTDEKLRRVRRAAAGYERPVTAIDAIGITCGKRGVTIRWLRAIS